MQTLVTSTNEVVNWLQQPWHWAVSGAGIALVFFLITIMGRKFGISSSFESACAAIGAGRKIPYFQNINLQDEGWRFAFILGTIAGGFFTMHFLYSGTPVPISESTVSALAEMGIDYPASDKTGIGLLPTSLFNFLSVKGILLAIAGGFLVGFGARYAGGCTSGHAITGLSHLQLPSLITVIGFFIGGIVMFWVFFPFLAKM